MLRKLAMAIAASMLVLVLSGCTSVQATQTTDAGERPALDGGELAEAEAPSQAAPSFTACSIQTSQLGELNYWLYTPANPTDDMPLIVYLHSTAGKGDDLELLMSVEGFPKYLHDGALGDVPAYVVIPQIPTSQRGWTEVGASVIELVEELLANPSLHIDRSNVSMTGHSVGGTGNWNIAIERPDLFARIAPLSGGVRASKERLDQMSGVSVWAFVGSDDTVVDPAMSSKMVEAMQNRGYDARITTFEGAGHEDVPALAYLDEGIGLVGWLIGANLAGDVGAAIPSGEVNDENGSSSPSDDRMAMYSKSSTIEKEQPELTDETKQAIARYHRDPTPENYQALRDIVSDNYDAVLERKEAKLAELKAEASGKPGGDAKIAEMEDIVREMHETREDRINSSMLRFTDPRILQWKTAEAALYDYIPVMGAGENVYVKRTPVTCAEYAVFVEQTGHAAPETWDGSNYPEGEGDYPVNFVSYEDAVAFCAWLTERDGSNTYRLPTESEWELTAGHMPKDAAFNCGVADGRASVDQYADVTHGAHGAVDFWGNVWEWTSTSRPSSDGESMLGVKGGSWKSARTDCRTENRSEARYAQRSYDDVGFRVVQERG